MRSQASRQRPRSATAPPHTTRRHVPFTQPTPRSCPSFPSFLRRQESMRPQASRQRPRSATAPTTHATLPSPTPPLGLAPLFRHSCAGRNPCDLKLFVSAQPADGPPTIRATLPSPTPPLGPAPLFRHSCAGRNPCDLKLPVSAPNQRRPPPLAPRSLHPARTLGLAPHFPSFPVQARGRLCAGRNPCDLKLPVSAPDQRRTAATHATFP